MGRNCCQRVLALATVAFCIGLAPAAATQKQGGGLLPQPAKPAKPAAKAPEQKPAKTAGPDLSNCVRLSVTVARRDRNGEQWDSPIRSGPEPDIRIYESASGFKSRDCDNTFSCTVRLKPRGKTLNLKIVDVDTMRGDETIGSGQCALKPGSCRLGLANVRLSGC